MRSVACFVRKTSSGLGATAGKTAVFAKRPFFARHFHNQSTPNQYCSSRLFVGKINDPTRQKSFSSTPLNEKSRNEAKSSDSVDSTDKKTGVDDSAAEETVRSDDANSSQTVVDDSREHPDPQKPLEAQKLPKHSKPTKPIKYFRYASLMSAVLATTSMAVLSFVGVGTISVIDMMTTTDLTLIFGSVGSTAVVIFGYPHADFSQPRNVIGGNIVGVAVGVAVTQALYAMELVPHELWYAGPLAGILFFAFPVEGVAQHKTVSLAIVAMKATNTMHPPAGGTCLMTVIGSAQLHALGYWVLIPTTAYNILLILFGLLHNFSKTKKYPLQWW